LPDRGMRRPEGLTRSDRDHLAADRRNVSRSPAGVSLVPPNHRAAAPTTVWRATSPPDTREMSHYQWQRLKYHRVRLPYLPRSSRVATTTRRPQVDFEECSRPGHQMQTAAHSAPRPDKREAALSGLIDGDLCGTYFAQWHTSVTVPGVTLGVLPVTLRFP
jgi:hypothetical protein